MNMEGKQMSVPDQLSRQAAAEWLAARLPDKTATQWELWLRNNSNSARRAVYRVPSTKVGRHAFYAQTDLDAFVKFEHERHIGGVKVTGRAAEALFAFGIGTPTGTPHGRKWKGGNANPSPANDGGVFVQMQIVEPLLVFAMTPDEAIEFGKELLDAGQYAKQYEAAQ